MEELAAMTGLEREYDQGEVVSNPAKIIESRTAAGADSGYRENKQRAVAKTRVRVAFVLTREGSHASRGAGSLRGYSRGCRRRCWE